MTQPTPQPRRSPDPAAPGPADTRRAPVVLRAALTLLAWLFLAAPAWAGGLVVDVLDVGQGDAVLVRTQDKAVLIDAGLRKANVVGQLEELGVRHLDLVVTTHPHADHMGGMIDVLEKFRPRLYLDNGLPHGTKVYEKLMERLEDLRIPYRTANRGMTMKLGEEAVFEVLFPKDRPLRDTRSDLNSNSVVLRLDHGEVAFLFTGDAEEPTEAALVRGGRLEGIDLLKVAHHGSAHSSTNAFLRAVEPEFAVISCGTDNRYGHPDDAAMKRLKKTGAVVFRTDLSGQVRAISDGDSLELLEGTLEELARMPLPWSTTTPRTATGSR